MSCRLVTISYHKEVRFIETPTNNVKNIILSHKVLTNQTWISPKFDRLHMNKRI